MTDPVRDAVESETSSEAHDALVKQFDTEVAPALEAFRRSAAADPRRALRRLYEAGEGVLPQAPPVRRILQRLAAGVIEVQLLARFTSLHFHWLDAEAALAQPELCRAIAGVGWQEIERADEMLFGAIMSAAGEAKASLDETFDAEMWADVLTEILRPQRPASGGACEMHDIATLRLIRAAKRGAFVGASLADDEGDGDDAA